MESQVWWRSPRLCAAAVCFGLGVVLLVGGVVMRLSGSSIAAPPVADTLEDPFDDSDALPFEAEGEDQATGLVVYVSGAVLAPDVYQLPAGARVKDAVAAAGGLSADADGAQLNLAEPLSDAQHIHVPFFAGVVAAAPAAASEAPDDGLVDLNQASAAELEDLPGIGATLASRILARREEQGPYSSVEELREVSGVGEKLFAQIEPLVTVRP